jgi:hypothetical protein
LENLKLGENLQSELLQYDDLQEKLEEIEKWKEEKNYYNGLALTPADSDFYPNEIIKNIETKTIESMSKEVNSKEKKEIINISPIEVYQPLDPFPKNSNHDFNLGDRVIDINGSGAVPFGSEGVIVGIHSNTAEVIFDDIFMGGTKLENRLETFRGKQVLMNSLINTTKPKYKMDKYYQPKIVKNIEKEEEEEEVDEEENSEKNIIQNLKNLNLIENKIENENKKFEKKFSSKPKFEKKNNPKKEINEEKKILLKRENQDNNENNNKWSATDVFKNIHSKNKKNKD